jgi:hypothetical protein
MAPRTVYANLPDGLANLNLWDQSLADMGSLGMIPCTAAGTNAITLTPIASAFAPNISAPPLQLQNFTFVAANTSTGAVTVQVVPATGSGAFLKLYRMDGVTQAAANDILSGVTYTITYNSALNGAAGGYQILAPISNEINPIITGATISNSAISSSTISGSTITTSTYNGNTWTAGTGTLTIAALKTLTANNSITISGVDGKTLTVNNNLTIAGTDGTTMTFPTTSATIARTDAGQTFTGTQAFGALTATTVNGNTITTGTFTLTGVAAKTLTFNNTLTLAGTDSTTITFQGTDTYVGRATTDTLTNKTIDTAGPNTLKVGGVALSIGEFPGTNTNDNATAGNIGEYVESVVAIGSATNNTTNVAKNVTSISLSAGDWDVDGVVQWNSAASTSITVLSGSISLTTGTMDSTSGRISQMSFPAFVPGSTTAMSNPIPPLRFSLSSTTTLFLVSLATFTVSNLAPYGIIRARRVR